MSVLEVKNVSIRYKIGDFKSIGLKEYVLRRLQGRYHVEEFWADRQITFSLEKGEMLGIIGTNGAGKSTLLKAVAGIMEPTEGTVRCNGNVAALLELASGFDGELTVKENAYLRGAMLGYTRKFMDEHYGEIIRFAELEDFQDRAFKQLSSGMKSRLAFAVASMVRPDLLILDEVLSVGDGAFAQKSAAKMQEIMKSGAATILVSHSIDQIYKLCTKVLWLDKGRQIAIGKTAEICNCYQDYLKGKLKIEEVQEYLEKQIGAGNTTGKGTVYFFTGLAGAGKTTIGRVFYEALKSRSPDAVLLDGDDTRDAMGDRDYSTEGRRRGGLQKLKRCLELSNQGIDVVICMICLYSDIRAWARQHIENYREIYVKVKWETLLKRNQKGLYSPGQKNVVGVDLPWDEPDTPDVTLENDGEKTPEEMAEYLIKTLGWEEKRPL